MYDLLTLFVISEAVDKYQDRYYHMNYDQS